MKGITSVTFRQLTVEEIIALASDNGLDVIEWGGDVHVMPGDVDNAQRVRELTEKAGLHVSSYGSYYKVGIDEISAFEDVLASAEALGAKAIRVWAGDKDSDKVSDEEFAHMVDCYKAICDMAAEKGIKIGSEFHHRTFNDSGECAMRLIKAVDKANFGTYWQPIDYSERDLANLKAVLDYVINVHVFAWNKYGKRYKLKKQFKLWQEYITAFGGHDVNFIMEFVKHDSPKAFIKDAVTLHKLLG